MKLNRIMASRLAATQRIQPAPMDIDTLVSVCGNIRLSADVDEQSVNNVIDSMIRINLFNPENPIDLEVSTRGGSCQDGLRLLSWINKISNPITVRGEGAVCSMGATILCANERTRVISKTARIMIHSASTVIYGNVREVSDDVALLKEMDDILIDLFCSRSGVKTREMKKLFDGFDHWLTPAKAKEMNLIDEII